MSPTDPAQADRKRLVEIEGHYHQALSLTKGLLSEIRAHGAEIDLESLAQRLKEREEALHKAVSVAPGSVLAKPGKKGLEPECRTIQRVAQETYDLGEELACLLTRVREDTREELGGYESGGKLMRGYKGFKAKTALRFDRQV
jgi:hypothetical protein